MGFRRENWGSLHCDECTAALMEGLDNKIAPYRDLLEDADNYEWLISDRPRRYYCPNCRAKHERETTKH